MKAKDLLLSHAINKVILVVFIELLEFSEDRSPWESVEEKLNEIR